MIRNRTDGKRVMNICLDGRLADYMMSDMAPQDCPNSNTAVATMLLERLIRDHRRITAKLKVIGRNAAMQARR